MLICVNRSIFKALNAELRKIYVYDSVLAASNGKLDCEEEGLVSDAIVKIIENTEEWHEKYGVVQKNGLKQVDETCMIPGWSEPSGYYRLQGLTVGPFDWSWDDNGDFNYAFEVFRIVN